MSSLTHDDQGFGMVEGLLILLIILILAAVGWYVWHIKQAADKTLTVSTSTVSKSATAESKQYIEIKEWNMRVPMPSNVDVSDIYYRIGTDGQNGNSPEAFLASHKLDEITNECVPQFGYTPFGSIERMTPEAYTQAAANPADTGVNNGVLLSGYYYVWQTTRANCYAKENSNETFKAGLMKITDNGNATIDNFPTTTMVSVLKGVQNTR